MKIAIIGAGAVGTLLGATLAGVNEVTMVARKGQVKEIRKNGLHVEGIRTLHSNVAAVEGTKDLSIQDVVMVCVKSYDGFKALQDARRLIGPGTQLLVVQNGLDVLGMASRVGFSRVNIGVATLGVTYLGPGKVRFAGKGTISIGNVEGRKGSAALLVQIMKDTGLGTTLSDDIIRDVWRKAIINASINPITAVMRSTNRCVLEDEWLADLSRQVFSESMEVALTWGALRGGDVDYEEVVKVARATADNRSSMLQDLESGKLTEIDSINGAMCRLAPDQNMVIANRTLWSLIKAQEKGNR